MSVFRVITRIVPLTGNESSFKPASFDQLTNGSAREANVSTFTDPTSGITYLIERIEDLQHCEPCETVESVNKAFAEKLSNISGFVQIQDNDLHSDSYTKNFKFSFPQTVSLTKDAMQGENSKFEISIVNNLIQVYNEGPLNWKEPGLKASTGLTLHVVDVYLDELGRLFGEMGLPKKVVAQHVVDLSAVSLLLTPFFHLFAKTREKKLKKKSTKKKSNH